MMETQKDEPKEKEDMFSNMVSESAQPKDSPNMSLQIFYIIREQNYYIY